MERRFEPAGPLRGRLGPPPDKSISHRAALIGAMSEGQSLIQGYLDSDDTRSTLAAIVSLGARIEEKPRPGFGIDVTIRGIGLQGLTETEIDVGNAGTLLRILPGWLAGQGHGMWELDGDESIRRRPVDRIAEPLRMMGARVECRDGRLPPLRVEGARLRAIEYRLPVASAQVKSCLLLAGLLADAPTTVIESSPTRDHTERMLVAAGARVEVDPAAITVHPVTQLHQGAVAVPGDFSSASFALVAAALVAGSELQLTSVGLNPTRTGLLRILERMGARVEVEEEEEERGAEPMGSIRARSSKLHATEIGGEEIPLAIDELPLVALAACFADGETVIRDAAELRHKESDRIASVCDGLAAIGADVEATEDGMVIRGTGGLRGGTLDSRGDHRLAMMGAVAGLASREGVTVPGFEFAAVSYPGFEQDLASIASGAPGSYG